MKEQQLRNKGIITAPSIQQQLQPGSAVLGAGRITQLEAQLKQAKVSHYIIDLNNILFAVIQWSFLLS